MSANALAKALHVTAARINEIVKEERGVTLDTALRLARYFGGDAQSWLNLQLAYDLKIAEKALIKTINAEIVPLAAGDERFALAA
jgi:addiction module HigA family antidote